MSESIAGLLRDVEEKIDEAVSAAFGCPDSCCVPDNDHPEVPAAKAAARALAAGAQVATRKQARAVLAMILLSDSLLSTDIRERVLRRFHALQPEQAEGEERK